MNPNNVLGSQWSVPGRATLGLFEQWSVPERSTIGLFEQWSVPGRATLGLFEQWSLPGRATIGYLSSGQCLDVPHLGYLSRGQCLDVPHLDLLIAPASNWNIVVLSGWSFLELVDCVAALGVSVLVELYRMTGGTWRQTGTITD